MLTWMLIMTGCQLKDKFESAFNGEANRAQDDEEVPEETVTAELINIQRSNISTEKIYPAFIEGRQSVRIIPRIEGYLQEILVKEGEHVKNGQTLFIMDQANYKAEISIAKANVDAAKAEVANAQLSLDSKKVLREKNIISEFELRQAEISLSLDSQCKHDEPGTGTPSSSYILACDLSISPTLSRCPLSSKHSIRSTLSSSCCIV